MTQWISLKLFVKVGPVKLLTYVLSTFDKSVPLLFVGTVLIDFGHTFENKVFKKVIEYA